MAPPGSSTSSRTMFADFPPSSRKIFFTVAEALAMMRRPVTVEPVKVIMSTLGSDVSTSPTRWSEDATTFTTPAGMSVCSAMIRPRTVADQGVSGAGLRTTVLPAASAGPSLARFRFSGKFQGVIAPTTPTARGPRRGAGPGRTHHGRGGSPRTRSASGLSIQYARSSRGRSTWFM